MMTGMASPTVLEREEYVEQAYFFRNLRERMAGQMAAQDVLSRLKRLLEELGTVASTTPAA